MDSGTLLDFMPPRIMVGVNVMRERALSKEANRGFVGSTSAMISSMLDGEGRCSMAKVDRWSKRPVEVSNSGSNCSMLLNARLNRYMALVPCQGTDA